MIADRVTSVQYAGLLQGYIIQRKANPDSEEARVQRILEEERKRVQPVAEATGKKIEILI